MARARNIKPGFFKNEFLAELPCEARLLFIGLWCLADREGRLEDRPKRIKAELFAFDSFDVDSMLNLLQRDQFILRYEIDGLSYIQIENFVKHQDPHYKEKASEIAPPPGRGNLIVASGVTRTQRVRIYERDSYSCQSCGAKEHLCIDHILPVSRGGDSSDDNLQTLCLSCNTRKGNKLYGEEKNSRKRRVNIDPNLIQRNDASPSDSLIPDSLLLIPDSGFLNPSIEHANACLSADKSADPVRPEENKPDKLPQCPHKEIIALWGKHLPHLIQPRTWEGARAQAMRSRWVQAAKPSPFNETGYKTTEDGIAWWDSFFAYVATTTLARGFENKGRNWKPDLEWVLNQTNFQKIIDGRYEK